MEENTVELFDYISVIWKRKLLIIVVTLVCIGIGVGVVVRNSRSNPLPVTSYSAEAVIKIGQKVKMSLVDAYLVPMDSPGALVETISFMYADGGSGTSGYRLEAKQIGAIPMLKLTMSGPDKEVERILKGVVDTLVDEHLKKAEFSTNAYRKFIRKLEEDARMIHENISIIEASIVKMKGKEKMFLEHMGTNEEEINQEKDIGDLSVIWNMLYLKTIDKEIDLSKSRQDLRNIQWQLLVHRTTIESLKKYNTRMVGEISMKSVVKNSKESSTNIIIVAVVAGLIMSLFIAFFWEYIEESKARRKGK